MRKNSRSTSKTASSDSYVKPSKLRDYMQLELKSNQKEIINFFKSNQIGILTGDPGTAKTTMTLYRALEALFTGEVEQIIITKPIVECGKSMGFLPGTADEKIAPYLESYIDVIVDLVGKFECGKLFNAKKILFKPIQFVRGKTFKRTFIVYDEAQNSELHEIISFATRIHETSKMAILGDITQSDIRHSGLEEAIWCLTNDVDGADVRHLGDDFQMRSRIIRDIYANYKTLLKNKKR
jgi:phosphate starvation-inducible PhoH-like protein